MVVVGEFPSQRTQLFESLVQRVSIVIGFVDDPAMLEWIECAMNGTPVDIGVVCNIGCGPGCLEVVEDAERRARQQFRPFDVRILLGDFCE
jgi:hypothetical protein